MRVHRKLLYVGAFFVALGGVLLVAQGSSAADDTISQALRLWPLAVIAIGIGLLVRRSRFATAGGVLAAAVPGLLLGGMIVAVPDFSPGCGDVQPASFATQVGTFGDAAAVNLELNCGELDVTTAPGHSWQVQTGDTGVPVPMIRSTPDGLSVASADRTRAFGMHGTDVWRIALPGDARLDLSISINAGSGRLDLAGATLGDLRLDVNAADAHVDLSAAAVDRVSLTANAAAVAISLPSGSDVAADATVNAGALRVCVADGTGLRVNSHGTLIASDLAGLVRNGDAWESPGYATASHHADVTVKATLASVDVNPKGGCK